MAEVKRRVGRPRKVEVDVANETTPNEDTPENTLDAELEEQLEKARRAEEEYLKKVKEMAALKQEIEEHKRKPLGELTEGTNTYLRDQKIREKEIEDMKIVAHSEGEEEVYIPVVPGKTTLGHRIDVSINGIPFSFIAGLKNKMSNDDEAYREPLGFRKYHPVAIDRALHSAGAPREEGATDVMDSAEFRKYKEDDVKFQEFLREHRNSGRLYFVGKNKVETG